MKEAHHSAGRWISWILQFAFFTAFGAGAISKFIAGPSAIVQGFEQMFQPTWLPMWIVIFWAWVVPYIEAVLAVWLISGVALKWGWALSGFYMAILGFGLSVAGQYQQSALNYLLIVPIVIGLYYSCCNRVAKRG